MEWYDWILWTIAIYGALMTTLKWITDRKANQPKPVVSINLITIIPSAPSYYIAIELFNKGKRPLSINEYGLILVKKKLKMIWKPFEEIGYIPISKKRLEDGENTQALFSHDRFEQILVENLRKPPIKIKAYFRVGDKTYYSKKIIYRRIKK